MNKKLWIGFIAVCIAMILTDFVIHVGLLGATYRSEEVAKLMRPESDSKVWIHFVTAAFKSFFFVLIFSKGYEGKGIAEGVRYGFYVSMMMAMGMAYDSYAAYPLPYMLALQWFIYGVIQFIILGIVAAMVFGKKPGMVSAA